MIARRPLHHHLHLAAHAPATHTAAAHAAAAAAHAAAAAAAIAIPRAAAQAATHTAAVHAAAAHAAAAHAAAPAADARDRAELLQHAGRGTQRRALQVGQWPAVARLVVCSDARLVAGLAQPDRGDKQVSCDCLGQPAYEEAATNPEPYP